MFKKVFVFILLITVTFFIAQERLNLRVAYQMEVNFNSTDQVTTLPKVDCYLYVQDGVSKFDMYFEKAEKLYPGQFYPNHVSVYKDFNKNEMYGRAIGYKNDGYVIKDSLNNIEWKLQDSIRIIGGRSCKLATTHWRDFDWEAWYDEDIPISEGPYKLNGLPGLILAAKAKSCSNIIYNFNLIDVNFRKDSLKKYIFYPFVNPEFKLIDYATFYADISKSTLNNLKNNYLRSKESDVSNDVITGKSCSSSTTFDFCFCYP
ncbi:GLPGLI family protein [Halpernia humi]|uniref:GLPGLI family protein n=1 Tax=Halpernia humi TaxID=493375 RepID=A0A1H5US33_9FLAO|nr:GLPGLI family protein [Halpernia humi]SEF77241.1 GLPGLI family protein [Halpernia humi]